MCPLSAAASLPVRGPALQRHRIAPTARRRTVSVRAFRESEDTVTVPLDVCQALGVSRAASRASCVAAFDGACANPPDVGYSQVRGRCAALKTACRLRSGGSAFETSDGCRTSCARVRRCSRLRRTR